MRSGAEPKFDNEQFKLLVAPFHQSGALLAPKQLATQYMQIVDFLKSEYQRNPKIGFSSHLSKALHAMIKHVAGRQSIQIDVVGLGRLAAGEALLGEPLSLLALRPNRLSVDIAKGQIQDFSAFWNALGAPPIHWFKVGDSVQNPITPELLKAMDFVGLTMPQRFGLGISESIWGDPTSLQIVRKVAYSQPLTPERLKELIQHKKHITSQNLHLPHRHRDLEWGHGGLQDLDWMLHLLELRYPNALEAGAHTKTLDRIKRVGQARLLNAVEIEELGIAFKRLNELRIWLSILMDQGRIVPENPDRLSVLAELKHDADPNAFLKKQQRIMETVQHLFQETLERLRA